jgi:hypothetical protein
MQGKDHRNTDFQNDKAMDTSKPVLGQTGKYQLFVAKKQQQHNKYTPKKT